MGTISAKGFNLPALSPLFPGLPVSYTPLSGGSVTLSTQGTLTTGAESLVDVSGSPQVPSYLKNTDGGVVAETVAGNAGSITISATGGSGLVELNGIFEGQAQMAGLEGGTLSINQQGGSYSLSSSDFARWSGFDSYTFTSSVGLNFSGDMTIEAARSLTFDAPVLTATGNVTFKAPYIQLWNDQSITTSAPASGPGQLTLAGQWVDVEGSVSLSGFNSVTLSATHDITLSDSDISNIWQDKLQTAGTLTLQADRIYPTTGTGNTSTDSSPFTIESSLGNIYILGSTAHNTSPVYSAGGYMKIYAPDGNIDMEGGMLAAPMGSIWLDAPTGYVKIGAGSIIDTSGSISVNYGVLTQEVWTILDKVTNQYTITVTGAPSKEVQINASDVTIESGSQISVSGGGGIFAYQFQSGIPGTIDPFQNPLLTQQTGTNGIYTTEYYGQENERNLNTLVYDWTIDSFRQSVSSDTFAGRWVIVPGSNYSVPASSAYLAAVGANLTGTQANLQIGEAVSLQAAPGLKAGVYTLLPEQYAFLPGAMIVTDTGLAVTSGSKLTSGNGYPVVAGYLTYAGENINIKPSVMSAFEVQPASALLPLGDFSFARFSAGNGGNVTIQSTSASLEGTIAGAITAAAAAAGFTGGTISLGADYVYVEPDGFNFSSLTPTELSNSLYIASSSVSGKGFQEIDLIANQNLTLEGPTNGGNEGAILEAATVSLSAGNRITLESGSSISALSTTAGNGNTVLTSNNNISGAVYLQGLVSTSTNQATATGNIDIEAASISATNAVILNTNTITFSPQAKLGSVSAQGLLDITGGNGIYIDQQNAGVQHGLYLPSGILNQFANFSDVSLTGNGNTGIQFQSNCSLLVTGSLTLNAALIEAESGVNSVNLSANTIYLDNTGSSTVAVSSLSPASAGTAFLKLNATGISSIADPYAGSIYIGGETSGGKDQETIQLYGFGRNDGSVDGATFSAEGNIAFVGAGLAGLQAAALSTSGDLTFSAARVTTMSPTYLNSAAAYVAADFTVTATGTVNINSNGAKTDSVTPGGTLAITGNSIDVKGGKIQMSGGTLTLTANGSGATDNVSLSGGAQILDNGIQMTVVGGAYAYSPGGNVYLNSENGSVTVDKTATINVSGVKSYSTSDANDFGANAGLISIYSSGTAVLAGTFEGTAGTRTVVAADGTTSQSAGAGGSFILDTYSLPNGFSALNSILSSGGFNNNVVVRVRGPEDETVTGTVNAYDFSLAADQGSITVNGVINANGANGGSVQISAGDNITLNGTINANGTSGTSTGGTVFLNVADGAGGAIILGSGSAISVTGQSQGGTVHFRAPLQTLSNGGTSMNITSNGTTITGASQILAEGVVYGVNGQGQNDSITMQRANANFINMQNGINTITSSNINNWETWIGNFMTGTQQGATIQNSQGNGSLLSSGFTIKGSGATQTAAQTQLQFVTGLEVDSQTGKVNTTGNMTLGAAWDFGAALPGNPGVSWDHLTGSGTTFTPGFLTLRAAGDLNIDANLIDHPGGTLTTASGNPAWGFNLVAGADFASANPIATNLASSGALYIGGLRGSSGQPVQTSAVQVYTEGGSIQFASAGMTWIGASPSTSYIVDNSLTCNIGSFSGNIKGQVGGDLDMENGGVIETATGNIDIDVEGNLNLYTTATLGRLLGSIRTTGEGTGLNYTYSGGGNISLYVKGNVNGEAIDTPSSITSFNNEGWDAYDVNFRNQPDGWSASYGNGTLATEGLATMAGGDLTVYAGGNFYSQAGTFSPYSLTASTSAITNSTPANDPGNLIIFSGGDMQGRFLVADGTGELKSMGNFGTSASNAAASPTVIEMLSAAPFTAAATTPTSVNVSAQGDIVLAGIVNPTIARPFFSGTNPSPTPYWDLTYSPSSSVSLTSATGNVTLNAGDPYYIPYKNGTDYGLNILPATLSVYAHGDINIKSSIILAPYKDGQLILEAGEDIGGPGQQATISMSDMSDDTSESSPAVGVYGYRSFRLNSSISTMSDLLEGNNSALDDPAGLLHASDYTGPVVISAGGNIGNLVFSIPKAAQITAGGDIENISYKGYNCAPTNVTRIQALGDIVFPYSDPTNSIYESGPGSLVIEAGGSINLGNSQGILVVGNTFDTSQLPFSSAALVVAAGYDKDFSDTSSDTSDARRLSHTDPVLSDPQFFDSLRTLGKQYAEDLAKGDTADAQKTLAEAKQVISSFLESSDITGAGDINMTYSQISNTTSGIYIFSNGSVNIGGTAFLASIGNSGIITEEGGAINVFANKDVNVNESRLMTFLGGDITVWTDTGSINAGIGSKTAIETTPPVAEPGNVLVFSAATSGSGIRALTYNPAPEEGIDSPPAGDVYLFAPTGVINAGEAGIAGRNVILAALRVLNFQNISFTQGEIGIPSSSNLAGLTALTGQGSIAQALQDQEMAFANAAAGKAAPIDTTSYSFVAPELNVRVLSFFDVDQNDSSWESTDEGGK